VSQIHPTAIISDKTKLGENVTVGPYVVIRGDVTLGAGSVVDHFATIGSEHTQTQIGERTRIHPGAVVGEVPQDLKYKGETTKLTLGSDNVIREYATIDAGTPHGGGLTEIGNKGLFMNYVHIAHDCKVGHEVVIANATQLAGHVDIADHVKIGGVCCFNQFVRVGTHAYIAGDSSVNKDVAPFAIAQGKYAVMRAANQVGMDRAGFDKKDIEAVRKAIRIITKGGDTVDGSLERIAKECEMSPALERLIEFVKTSERGLAI